MALTVYATSCTDNDYSGLLNGGESSWEQYSLNGNNLALGLFAMDLSKIQQNIPRVANISNIVVSHQFRQSRSSTNLYVSRIKTTIYNGSTIKMNEQTSGVVGDDYTTQSYTINNITSKELYDNGLTVHLTAYYKGTLRVTQYARQLKADINWSPIYTNNISLNKTSTTLDVGNTEVLTYTIAPSEISYPRCKLVK